MHHMSRTAIQVVTGVLGIVPVVTGLMGLRGLNDPLYGPVSTPHAILLDTNLRFFSGLWWAWDSPSCGSSRRLPAHLKWFVRLAIPAAAILLPSAFFLSVLPPDATAPNGLISLAYVGALVLAAGVLLLGVGLLRRPGGAHEGA